jgi:hypothetical protein
MNGKKASKDETRWVAFETMLKWFLFIRRRTLEYIDEKQPIQAPIPAFVGPLRCSCPIVRVDAGNICYTAIQAAGLFAACSGD